MSATSGLAAQTAYKSETTVGTPVTPDKFEPFLGIDMKNEITWIPVEGIYAGKLTQRAKKKGQSKITGTWKGYLLNKPLACLLTHMFGTVVTTGTGPTYVHTATPGLLKGKALTLETGLPDDAGTVNPMTYAGVKITSWTISAAVGGLVTLDRNLVAMTEDADGTPSLTAATYLTGIEAFSFVNASITAGGSSLGVITSASLTGDSGVDVDRFGLGSSTISEALDSARRVYSGSIEVRFLSMVAYNLYLAGTDFALVYTFSNGTDSLVITMNAYYTGTTPAVDGAVSLKQTLPFTCQAPTASGTDATAITAVLTNGETVAT